VNLVEREEAVAVAAVFDERRLERRLHAGHFGEIDISFELLLGRCLEIELFQSGSVDYDHPGLFRMVASINMRFAIRGRTPLRTARSVTSASGRHLVPSVARENRAVILADGSGRGRR
jgi:hypothetical protein